MLVETVLPEKAGEPRRRDGNKLSPASIHTAGSGNVVQNVARIGNESFSKPRACKTQDGAALLLTDSGALQLGVRIPAGPPGGCTRPRGLE